jgi:hypothetical protein
MIENGAQMVQAIELNPNYNHTQCVTPAATSFVFFLLVFSEVTSTTSPYQIALNVYPNPASNGFQVVIDDLNSEFSAEIHNMSGIKMMTINSLYSGNYIQSDLPSGMYIITVKDKAGKSMGYERIVIHN